MKQPKLPSNIGFLHFLRMACLDFFKCSYTSGHSFLKKLFRSIFFKNRFFFNCGTCYPQPLTPIAAPSQLPIVIGVRLRHQLVGSTIGARRYRRRSVRRARVRCARTQYINYFDQAYIVYKF